MYVKRCVEILFKICFLLVLKYVIIQECGDVPTVIKGSVTLLEEHNTTFSALANVICDTGYNASIGILQCLETGQWQTTKCHLLGKFSRIILSFCITIVILY
jgi:hypothetical protein